MDKPMARSVWRFRGRVFLQTYQSDIGRPEGQDPLLGPVAVLQRSCFCSNQHCQERMICRAGAGWCQWRHFAQILTRQSGVGRTGRYSSSDTPERPWA